MKTTHISLMAAGLMALATLTSCEKDQSATNKFSGGTWEISSLKVAGVASSEHLPDLMFMNCDVSDEICTGEASVHGSTEYAVFNWQVSEDATRFEFSNQTSLPDDASHDLEEAVIACQELSGLWVIEEMNGKEVRLTSSATVGHPGEPVEMVLSKE
jgi:hypothetical protein